MLGRLGQQNGPELPVLVNTIRERHTAIGFKN